MSSAGIELVADGHELVYTYDSRHETGGIALLLRQLHEMNIEFKDINTSESSLEDIFVSLVNPR